MNPELRRRYGAKPELRAEGESQRFIEGYAAVFDNQTELYRWGDEVVYEIIRSGAFAKSIARGDDVRALFDHESTLILGRTKAGTLELREDDKGLWYRISVPDTQAGRDLITSLERGDVTQSSFGFMVDDNGQRVTYREDGSVLRELLSVSLFDVSPVTFPAYADTVAEARSILAVRPKPVPAGTPRLNGAVTRLRLTEAGE